MKTRVRDLSKLTVRCSEAERARLLALSDLTGRPVYKMLLAAIDREIEAMTPEARAKLDLLTELKGSEART